MSTNWTKYFAIHFKKRFESAIGSTNSACNTSNTSKCVLVGFNHSRTVARTLILTSSPFRSQCPPSLSATNICRTVKCSTTS